MNAEAFLPVLEKRDSPAVRWDGEPAHQARAMEALPTRRVLQSAYSPALHRQVTEPQAKDSSVKATSAETRGRLHF